MKLSKVAAGLLLLPLFASRVARAAAEPADAPAAKLATQNKGKLVASEFCPVGTIGAPVGISVDDHGNIFVTESNRRGAAELDIRNHWDFLVGSLACKSVEDKRKLIHELYHKGGAGDQNHDGVQDWKDLLEITERVYRLTPNADGKFEHKTVFADHFNTDITGVAAGVLAFGDSVYTTVQPDLWKLNDTDGDGVADKRVSLSYGHGIHVGFGGHDMHGPTMGPDGRIYWSQGDKGYNITSKEGVNYTHQYEGAVFRVDPDGSNLEVFAYGLRNPQELAFDDFGNLFSVDNDSDLGDRERFVYITQDSDSGWRATYQYRMRKVPGLSDGGYNPWMAEDLWKPRFETQAAYITPPLANYADGPCGFKYNPGTALSEEYKGNFFLTQFPKKLLTTFKAVPDGAGFKMVDEHLAFSGLMMTGIAWGTDGSIYAADWGENAWTPHQKGRVVRIDVPETTHSALRVETQRLLAEGMAKRSIEEVAAFLSHADQRIRLRAQFELVNRGAKGLAALTTAAEKNESLLARVHAVWGLGQIARRINPSPIPTLIALLKDAEPEIRAQSAKVLADAHASQAADAIAPLLADASPHVRLLAGIALSKMARPSDLQAAVSMIDGNKTRDTFVRHAGIVLMAAAAAKDPSPLAQLANHPDRQVRLAAVVALRRLHSPLVEPFLNDKDEWVVTEAARAIHDDTSIPQSLPALAKMLGQTSFTNEALLRRAINANLRVGDADSAARLVAYATRSAPAVLRADALDALAWFAVTPKLDRVEGRYRDIPDRDAKIPQAALDGAITQLLKDPNASVRNATIKAIRQLHFDAARDRLAQLALDTSQPSTVRAPALEAIFALKSPQTRQAVEVALKDGDPRLRAAAIEVLAQLDPEKPATLQTIKSTLAGHSIAEQQAALTALGSLKTPESTALLHDWTQRLLDHKVPAPLQLDVLEAASANKGKGLPAKLRKYRGEKPKKDALAANIEALEGGDAFEGELIFKSGQCSQCHLVNNSGGNVGPDLSHVASRLPRMKLLQSVVVPDADIATGYATISVTTKDGDTLTGTLQSESPTELTLKDPEGQLVKVKKSDVDSRTAPSTAMPPMGEVLKPREIRDVVEYLSTLK
jgi:putative membrane-bound dehydrogenase-like protein